MQTEYRDNPYVAVVAKKNRNLKKKMDRILKIESQILSGKALDEEQKVMYTTKSSVEKSLADLSSIQSALEEVAKEERERGEVSPSSVNDRGSEETKGQDAGVVDGTKQVAVIETSCSFENKSTSEVVEILLKTIYVVQGHRHSDDKAHEDVHLLGQSLLESSVAEAHRTAQNLLENVELVSKINDLYQQLNSSVEAPTSTTAAVTTAVTDEAEPAINASVSVPATEPVVSDAIPAVAESAATNAEGNTGSTSTITAESGDSPVIKEKSSRRRPRNKRSLDTATSVTAPVEDSTVSGAAVGATSNIVSELKTEVPAEHTSATASTTAADTNPSPTTTSTTALDADLSTVVSSIPLPSPADIVAATADNILVPKRSFEAATAAVLAESVEINFFPIQPTVAPPMLTVPTMHTSGVAGVNDPGVPVENNFFLPDQNYLNHIVYPHAPIPAGLPMNSLLADIPGFGVDYSRGHSPYGVLPVGYEVPSIATANVMSVNANVAGAEDGKKRRNKNRSRGSKDGDREMSSTPVRVEASVAGSVAAVPAPAPVAEAATTTTSTSAAPVPAKAAATTTNVAPSANTAATSATNPVPSIVPVMGVGAALRYLQGMSSATTATPATTTPATTAPASINTANATASPSVAPVPVVEQTPAATNVGTTTYVEGDTINKRRRRRGKGDTANADALPNTTGTTNTANSTQVNIAAPVLSVPVVAATTTNTTITTAPPATTSAAPAVSANEGVVENEESRSRRARGTRGKGGKGNRVEGASAPVAGSAPINSSNTDSSATRNAPTKSTTSSVTAPVTNTTGTDVPAREQRAKAPRPATSNTDSKPTNTATATATVITGSSSPRPAGQSSGERRREGAPRPARDSASNTNSNTTSGANRDANRGANANREANPNTNRERSPRPENSNTATNSSGAAPSADRAPRPPRATGASTSTTSTGAATGAANNRSARPGSGDNVNTNASTRNGARPPRPAATVSKPANSNNSTGAKPSNSTSRPTGGAAVAK